jgi:molybdenum cofactor cytidylyltransferase
MTRASSFAGVILAAGESSRMGRDKALLPWPPAPVRETPSSGTFLSSSIRSLNSVCDFVVVVVGKNQTSLAPIIYAEGASLVPNPDPDRGQFSSLQMGLRDVLDQGRDAAAITLVDRPPVRPSTLAILWQAFASAGPEIWAVVPEYSGKHGHPYLIGREMIEVLLRAPVTSTARDVEHAHQQHIQYLAVDDPLVTANINSPEDYAALQNRTDITARD